MKEIAAALAEGAKKHGWPNELWTARRVKVVIHKKFGIDYHEGHVRKILTNRLQWTSQKPERRARERNEAAIERWRTV